MVRHCPCKAAEKSIAGSSPVPGSINIMNKKEAGKIGYLKTKDKLLKHVEKQKKDALNRNKNNKCLYCGKIIPYEKRRNKFCSRSCSGSYNNTGKVRRKKRA